MSAPSPSIPDWLHEPDGDDATIDREVRCQRAIVLSLQEEWESLGHPDSIRSAAVAAQIVEETHRLSVMQRPDRPSGVYRTTPDDGVPSQPSPAVSRGLVRRTQTALLLWQA